VAHPARVVVVVVVVAVVVVVVLVLEMLVVMKIVPYQRLSSTHNRRSKSKKV
jgi:hypothetical protein